MNIEFKWNAGIAPAQTNREATTTGINSVANGVSQATPAGIAAAKDAFEKTQMLGKLPGQVLYGGISSAAEQLSPAAYLKEFHNTEMFTESMRDLASVPDGMGTPKMFDGISQKLTRERLDNLSNDSEPQNFGEQNMKGFNLEKLARLASICKIVNAMNDVIKNGPIGALAK
jgi:hypothetical protein